MSVVKSISLSPEAYEALATLQDRAKRRVARDEARPREATASAIIAALLLAAAKKGSK